MEKTILTRESGHCPFKLLKKLFCFFYWKIRFVGITKTHYFQDKF